MGCGIKAEIQFQDPSVINYVSTDPCVIPKFDKSNNIYFKYNSVNSDKFITLLFIIKSFNSWY